MMPQTDCVQCTVPATDLDGDGLCRFCRDYTPPEIVAQRLDVLELNCSTHPDQFLRANTICPKCFCTPVPGQTGEVGVVHIDDGDSDATEISCGDTTVWLDHKTDTVSTNVGTTSAGIVGAEITPDLIACLKRVIVERAKVGA